MTPDDRREVQAEVKAACRDNWDRLQVAVCQLDSSAESKLTALLADIADAYVAREHQRWDAALQEKTKAEVARMWANGYCGDD